MSKNILKLSGLLLIAVVIIVGSVYLITRRPKVVYQYDQAKIGKIVETVDVSGLVKAAENIDLSFERSGKINKKYVTVGDQVNAGQTLLTLDNADATAALAQAQAALDKQLAGNRPEYIAQLEAAVSQAEANFNQVTAVSANSIHAAEAVKLTAENNLKLAQGGEDSRIVEDAYENTAAFLQAAQNTLANALTKADNILGMDNAVANDKFENLLSVKDLSKLYTAKDKYSQAKIQQQTFSRTVDFSASSGRDQIEKEITAADLALAATRDLLEAISAVLDNTVTGADLSLNELDVMKTVIQGVRAEIVAKVSSLTEQKHAIATAKNSYTTYQIAFNKVVQDLDDIKKKNIADVAAAQAALDKARAVLTDAKNPPREVDLASFRAAVYAAQVNYDKTIMTAPFAGLISRQEGELGTLALPNVPLVSLISNNKYQVEIYVAETDLPKIKIGDSAIVTLDNLGNDQKLPAQLIKIDPAASQLANGTSAYKATLQFVNEDERLKVGLAANVKIIGAKKDDALVIPAHDVVQKNGEYFVMILNSEGNAEQKAVSVGLKGKDDRWEITSGLQAGDAVISFSSLNN
ncbi:MAG: efflux RND transporter periplasmic adaptor subunit [Patescibacteria group bacterium]